MSAMNPRDAESAAEAWVFVLERPLSGDRCRRVVEALLESTPGEQIALMGGFQRSAQLQILGGLLEESYSRRHREPGRSLEIAVAAAALTEPLAGPRRSSVGEASLRAASLAFLANARRIAGDHRGAEEAWARLAAEGWKGEGNPYLRALLAELRASLARDQRRFAAARHLLGEAIEIYRQQGAVHFMGFAEVLLSYDIFIEGKTDEALTTLLRGLAHMAPGRSPGTALSALHNAVVYLSELGENYRAIYLLQQFECFYLTQGDALLMVRAGWLKGRVLSKLGFYRDAILLLDRARTELTERQLHFDAALAGLDLALALAETNDSVGVMRIAQEMYPVFVAHDIPREASMALLQFAQAAEALKASSETIRDTLRHLAELRRGPANTVPE